MSDMHLWMRPALAGKEPLAGPEVSMMALPEGLVVHVLTKWDAGHFPAMEELSAEGYSVREAGPGQWFIIGDRPLARAEVLALAARLGPDVACVDQSHGRVRILVSGPMVERVLRKGTGADLGLSAFPIGRATTTLFGHIAAHLTRTSELAFELMVLRGFAESLWDDLLQMRVGSPHL